MSTAFSNIPLLSLSIFLPLLGCFFILFIKGESEIAQKNAKSVALLTSMATFLLSLILYSSFDFTNADFQLIEKHTWISSFGISYHVGIDGISLLFILLTTVLIPVSILSSWKAIKYRVQEFMIAFLVLETMLIGIFSSLDFILFYLFFEAVLIPMFLIIGIWGGERRVYAAYKFFLYTLLGSVLMLISLLAIYLDAGTTDIPTLLKHSFDPKLQIWLWLAFFASFAVKIPMWPFHTWLPDAHVEAPTAGSVILAGVLLKMGGYGFVRFSLPMFPDACQYFATFIFVLSIIAIIYTSLVALVQDDMKKLIAYSSVAHMGFVTLGLFTFSFQGVQGAIFQMISHGLISGALFLCVGVLYDREHTRLISKYGGLSKKMPYFAAFFMIFTLASVGLPGTTGFVGEILVIISSFKVEWYWALAAGTGIILGAAYMLYLYRRVMFGKIVHENLLTIKDLTSREVAYFVPLILLIIGFGFYPNPLLKLSEAAALRITAPYDEMKNVIDPSENVVEEQGDTE